MSRLRSELQRLYLPRLDESPGVGDDQDLSKRHGQWSRLVDPDGMVRAMVLQIGEPANWESTAAIWRGVQRDLELPAPAIAVSGEDGYQLWFSLAEAVTKAQAHAFLKALQGRFLADLAPRRIRLMPDAADPALPQSLEQQAIVPALQSSGNWSAFVSPDLAPIFAETPWLDITPSDDGQADLLRGIRSIKRPEWEAAQERLGLPASQPTSKLEDARDPIASRGSPDTAAADARRLARQFLVKVMNDETVALALRIESAKALLQHHDGRGTDPAD